MNQIASPKHNAVRTFLRVGGPLPRSGLESARIEPNAMRSSIRTFGNGGFFSFSGFYWNKALGVYRAFVTDPRRAVVLRYSSKRTVVLSPVSPQDFIDHLGVPNRAS
jgi:Bacterial PH domain